jgi:regulator of sigma E protease
MIFTILLFTAILGILILVHESGHFFAAKKSGAKVEEFGIGFPPRIFSVKRGDTVYSMNLFPIGGFVKIFGEDGESRQDFRSFASKSVKTRSFIIFAGVLMNMILAVVLLSLGHVIGLPQVIEGNSVGANIKNISVRVVDVAKNSPAEEAGIAVGDIMAGAKNIEDIQNFIEQNLGKPITLTLKRGNEVLDKNITPRLNPPEGEGAIGIAMLKTGQISYPIYIAPIKGIESAFVIAWGTIKSFGQILSDWAKTGDLSEGLAGPVGIAVITGQVQKMGFIFLIQFAALISINLAIINILPFPALDGGRLLFIIIEKIKGSPVNQKYEKLAHTVGFGVLILLMILITFRDIEKFF